MVLGGGDKNPASAKPQDANELAAGLSNLFSGMGR